MRLNRNEPFDQIFGTPGVAFAQKGVLFNPGGHEVKIAHTADDDGADVTVAEVVDVPEPEVLAMVALVEVDSDAADEPEFSKMHWKTLQALLGTYGEDYTDRATAVAFLEAAAIK